MTSSVQLVIDRPVRRRIPRGLLAALLRALHRLVRGAAGHRAVVELRICDDSAMAALHARTFGDRHATDVLSFPAGPDLPGFASEAQPSRPWLGSIVVNWDAAVRQAVRRDGAGVLEEAVSLCLHSIAHLLGHDHTGRIDARRMLAAERRIGRRIGVVPRRPYGHSR